MLDVVCYLAAFCVAPDYAPAMGVSGTLRLLKDGRPVVAEAQAVQRLGVRLELLVGDNFYTVPAGRLRQTCVDDACVVFRVSCEASTCTWQAAGTQAGEERRVLSEVRLAAASPEALVAAKAAVFVPVEVAGERRLVSLAQLGDGAPTGGEAYLAAPWPGDRTRRSAD